MPSVTQYVFALSYHEIVFRQFKQNIFLSKHAKCVVLIYRGFCQLCLTCVCVGGGECQVCRAAWVRPKVNFRRLEKYKYKVQM